MRTFKIGSVEDRRFVILELDGNRLRVTKGNADGTTRKSEKELPDEAEARVACERMAQELISRGYRERNSKDPAKPRPAKAVAVAGPAKPTRAGRHDGLDIGILEEAGEGSSGRAEALLPRLAPTPASAEAAFKKKPGAKKKKKTKRKAEGQAGELDKKVIAGVVAAGLLCLSVVGLLGYKAFLAPASIVGHWEGSRTEHEIGKYLMNIQYSLVLDDRKNAAMSIGEGKPSTGTYALQGDRLKLAFKDEDGEVDTEEYKVKVGGATLDLYDPTSGKKMVQLIRFHKPAVVAGAAATPAAPQAVAGGAIDAAADEKLASVPFGVKDNAFRLKHPQGWEVETGARPDNTYSWARFTQGPGKIQVFADVAGSLMAGPNPGDDGGGEGSELAPVHGAHLQYKRQAAENYSDYQESDPAPFKGSTIGEGRIATFTASGGGVFGSKIKGIRVTLLTNDRRISALCEAPVKQFDQYLPAFLATCRSLAR